ncbi:MAG: electron transfer flavoprotein subunit alpha/FixB family protein, partial [Dehalococcoidia bacterium]
MRALWVVAEPQDMADPSSLQERLTAARDLAGRLGTEVVVVGGEGIVAEGADRLLMLEGGVESETLVALAQERGPQALLLPHTMWGLEAGITLAQGLGAALVTACLYFDGFGHDLRVVRNVCMGKLAQAVALPDDRPWVMCLLPGAFPPLEGANPPQAVERAAGVNPAASLVEVLEQSRPEASTQDIRQAKVLVALGRGVGGLDFIEQWAQPLAERLGGALAASRPAIDAGWLPHDRLVGVSGATVRPRVYLALGISGASQHVAGMGGSRCIIAVNRDPRAPIFRYAHYGVVGDAREIA